MDQSSQYPPDFDSKVLLVLEPFDRQLLEKRLNSGEISYQEFKDQVYEIAGNRLIKQLQICTPSLAAPNTNDKDFNLQEYCNTVAEACNAYKAHGCNLLEEVQKNAPSLVVKIFNDWESLRAIVGAYPDVLSRRWIKRTVDKRKALLLAAWPAMPPMHRPDFDVLRHRLRGPKYRDLFMMPYINQEDLSSPKHLLQLLSSRTRMPPEHFAWTDSAPFKAAVKIQAVQGEIASRNIILLTGKKTRESYGSLHVANEAEAEDIIMTGSGFHLRRGLTVLETQVTLYGFLLDMAKLLLHDIDLSLSRTKIHTYRQIEQVPEPREWLSITEANTQAFYELPRPFSLTILRRLVDAKRNEAEDYFWTLHEDPAFFQTEVLLYEPRYRDLQRTLLDLGNLSPIIKTEIDNFNNAWCYIVNKTSRNVVTWTAIADEISKLDTLRISLDIDQRSLSKRLPPEYEDTMGRFFCLVGLLWCFSVKDLLRVAMTSPNLAVYFSFSIGFNGAGSQFKLNKSLKNQWPPFIKVVEDLMDEDTCNLMGSMSMLEEMLRIVNSDPYHCASIQPQMIEEIPKLAALAQIRDALPQHQPMIQSDQDFVAVTDEYWEKVRTINDLERDLAGLRMKPSVLPISDFNYPVWKKRTCQNVTQMRLAEAKLDAFWKELDEKLLGQYGRTLTQYMDDKVTRRDIARTPRWQPTKEQQQQPRETTKQSLSATYNFSQHHVPDIIGNVITEAREKQKTRGTADPNRASSTPLPATPTQTQGPPAQVFRLHHRALKIIKAFYPTTTEDREGRKTLWKDFLHAMYSLGFEIQKRHGSEWYFEPTWQRNAPITIHEPHPSHEMRFEKMRFEANRMARKYGWNNGSFQAE